MNDTERADAIQAFAAIARGFCVWCESKVEGADREAQAALWLCRLYAAALALPDVEGDASAESADPPSVAKERAALALAEFQGWYYREYFDPHPLLDDESGMGDVGDDLLDIYGDICGGLWLFDEGRSLEAAWHWRFFHRVHWGRHAVGALFALHCMAISKRE